MQMQTPFREDRFLRAANTARESKRNLAGSSSTLELTIWGPSFALQSREKFRFGSLKDKTRTTALHPQSDGMVERFNRTILNNLSLLVSSNQQDWDKKLPFFLLDYRSSVHETTSYSPSQMLFGRYLHLPSELLFSGPLDAPLSSEEYIEKFQARMEEMHHLARERIGRASEKMKTRYDARATGHDFHEGDTVGLWYPKRLKSLSPKLQTNWEGPYTVLKRLNDVVVRKQKSPRSKNRR
ncbi:retrovirus-related Pol polyprotein from transposon 412 [Trichonephila clavipes]|nr:retrovirus-related Pol polyprotein from transposon 412 [Trichonephila clavipes]